MPTGAVIQGAVHERVDECEVGGQTRPGPVQWLQDAAQGNEPAVVGELVARVGGDRGLPAQRHHVGGASQAAVSPLSAALGTESL